MARLIACVALFFLVSQAALADTNSQLRILVMGDSLMTSNGSVGHAVPDLLRKMLNAKVKSTAVAGARYGYRMPLTGALGFNISKQYRRGKWDYVIMNGGGNDLWLGCGCRRCRKRLNRMISPDGSMGQIPTAVKRARSSGAKVVYLGYLRSPGLGSPIEHCKKLGNVLEARIAVMAKEDSGTSFVSLADMVPYGDRSFHGADMIHPSKKGSVGAARRIIDAIRLSNERRTSRP